jgi:hypothetical protein
MPEALRNSKAREMDKKSVLCGSFDTIPMIDVFDLPSP